MIKIIIFLCSLMASTVTYALPFNIVPKAGTLLPTQVQANGNVFAYYTIANNTHAFRSNNFLKYLPRNVSQITNGGTYPDTCGATFNLSGRGQAGDSCTLQLAVTGPVNGRDPNPRHHLFACFPGGLTCAGTNYPLNITQLAAAKTNAYVTNFSSNNVSLCPINNDDSFAPCTVTGGTFFAPGGIAIDPAGNYAYILDQVSGVSYCAINSDASLGACSFTSSLFSALSGITFNPAGSLAYITDVGTNRVYYCTVNSNGTLNNCLSTGSGFFAPFGIAINPAGTYAYITNNSTGNVRYCAINNNGSFGACNDTGSGLLPYGIAINASGTYAYITDPNSTSVIYCAINPMTGALNSCAAASSVFSFPNAIAINENDTIAYVTDFSINTTFSCPILGDGSFGPCVSTGNGFSGPAGVAVH